MMKPILFNTEMVRAILDSKKTVTRRCIKHEIHVFEKHREILVYDNRYLFDFLIDAYIESQSQYKNGDILYVRETWSTHYTAESDGKLVLCYKADGINLKEECLSGETNRWYPSIHMPKKYARIFLRVTNVRIERLHDITAEQAIKEGIRSYTKDNMLCKYAVNDDAFRWCDMPLTAIGAYIPLWNSTVDKKELDKYGWYANPYVFVYEFEIISKSEALELEEITR